MIIVEDTTSRALTLARVEERLTTGATPGPPGTTAVQLVIIITMFLLLSSFHSLS